MPKTVQVFRDPAAQQQMAQATREQQLAQAMMASGQSPDDMFAQWNRMPVVPAYTAGHGLTQLASSLAGAYIGKQATDKAAQAQAAEKAAGEKARAEAMARLMQTTNDTTTTTQAGPWAGGYVLPSEAGTQTTSQKKDYGQMLSDAMAASEAGVPKEVVEAYLKANEAYSLGDTRYLGNQPIASNEQPKDELAKLTDDLNGGRITLKDYMARRELLTTRSPGVNVSVNTEKNLYSTMAEKQAAENVTLYSRAQQAPELLERSRRVKQALGSDSKAITGAGAEWLLTGAKVAAQMGFNTGDAAADTEALARDLAASTLDGIKASGLGAGSGFSNADRDFLEKVVGGSIKLEGKTLLRLADLNEKSAIKTIQRWNSQADRLDKKQLDAMGIGRINLPAGMEPEGGPKLIQNPDGSFTYTP
jgi:hypothetical protein